VGFAQKYGHTADPYLTKLSDALDTNINLDRMLSLAPLEYLPGRPLKTGNNSLQSARLIAGIRNVLIFVPVALTWAAVGEATKAFNEFVQQNSGTPANFLQFWQDGYGVLDPFWSIGNIATIDFILVAAVIAMTGYVAVVQGGGQRQRERMSYVFEYERRELAIAIEALRFQQAGATRDDLPKDISKALRELRAALAKAQSAKEIDMAAKKLARQVELAGAASSRMREFSTGLESNSKSIAEAITRITKSTDLAARQVAKGSGQLGVTASKIENDLKSLEQRLKAARRDA
jgi:hypothetical protein